ncbi:MAG: hypothetical protein HC896_00360 [Bacteroidales bacterium]|nr:hypothetical protein [Bacteroidales bacterium]
MKTIVKSIRVSESTAHKMAVLSRHKVNYTGALRNHVASFVNGVYAGFLTQPKEPLPF